MLTMLPRTYYLACSGCLTNIWKTIHAMIPSENRTQRRQAGRCDPGRALLKVMGEESL